MKTGNRYVTFLFTIFPALVSASAFQEWEQSAISSGVAHADMAAAADNASTAYYNPAGMTRLDKPEISAGVSWATVNTHVYDMYVINDTGAVSVPDVEANIQQYAPNFHAVLPINTEGFGNYRLGFSVVAPYGAETFYNSPFMNTYARKTYLQAVLINPSLAAKLTDKLSVGAGVDIQEVQSIYSAHYGAVAHISSDISSWETSWNVGMLYEFTPHTRFGATYRPQMDYHQTGDFTFTQYTSGYQRVTVDASSDINLPATTTFGLYHDLNKRTSLMATAVYTEWDSIENLELLVPDLPQYSANLILDWRNTWLLGIGATHQMTKEWVLRGGFSYDRTPTIDATREWHVPDSDRYTFAVGTGYTFYDQLAVDVAYQYIYLPQVNTANPTFSAGDGYDPDTRFSTVKNNGNVLSLQLSWLFDN